MWQGKIQVAGSLQNWPGSPGGTDDYIPLASDGNSTKFPAASSDLDAQLKVFSLRACRANSVPAPSKFPAWYDHNPTDMGPPEVADSIHPMRIKRAICLLTLKSFTFNLDLLDLGACRISHSNIHWNPGPQYGSRKKGLTRSWIQHILTPTVACYIIYTWAILYMHKIV